MEFNIAMEDLGGPPIKTQDLRAHRWVGDGYDPSCGISCWRPIYNQNQQHDDMRLSPDCCQIQGIRGARTDRYDAPTNVFKWKGKVTQQLVGRFWSTQWPQAQKMRKMLAKYYNVPLKIDGDSVQFTKAALAGGVPHPVSSHGVVYCILCRWSKKIYVGSTLNSAMERFKQHATQAKRLARQGKYARPQDNDAFHRFMATFGMENFMVMPLKKMDKNREENKEEFTFRLRYEEDQWMVRLKSWTPYGWNSRRNICRSKKFGTRRRRIGTNPFIKNRVQHIPIQQQETNNRTYGYRDCRRRAAYLVKCMKMGIDPTIVVMTYSAITLTKMHLWLSIVVLRLGGDRVRLSAFLTPDRRRNLIGIIGREQRNRGSPMAAKRANKDEILVLPFMYFRDSYFRNCLMGILKDPDVIEKLPNDEDVRKKFAKLFPVFSYPPTMAAIMCNYKKTVKSVLEVDTDDAPCACRLIKMEPYIDHDIGHVCTGDMSVVGNMMIQDLLEKGAKFRLNPTQGNGNMYDFITILKKVLSKYVESQLGHKEAANEWIDMIATKMEEKAHQYRLKCFGINPDGRPNGIPSDILEMPEIKRTLRWLRHYFVCTLADKASSNFVIVCKRAYLMIVLKELRQSMAYEIIEDKVENDVVQEHLRMNSEMHTYVHQKEKQLPVLAYTVKLHKNPISTRFIAFSGQTTLTALSSEVGYVLSAILDVLKIVAHDEMMELGASWFFLIKDSAEVPVLLKMAAKLNEDCSDQQSICAYDIKNMYTSIEHEDLLEKIGEMIELAWQSKRNQGVFKVEGKEAHWVNERVNEENCPARIYNKAKLIKAIKFIVENSYVLAVGNLYRQTTGIPMGTNSSPWLANLYLMAYERKCIRSFCEDGENEKAQALARTARFLDDLLGIKNPDMEEMLQTLYPGPSIEVIETTIDDFIGHVHYMDLDIKCVNGTFDIDIWDKRTEMTIKIIRFPDASTMLAPSARYSIVTSQCYRFFRLLSSKKRFLSEVAGLCKALLDKNYSKNFVMGKARKFIYMTRRFFKAPFSSLMEELDRNISLAYYDDH
jgi:hypothetical protein